MLKQGDTANAPVDPAIISACSAADESLPTFMLVQSFLKRAGYKVIRSDESSAMRVTGGIVLVFITDNYNVDAKARKALQALKQANRTCAMVGLVFAEPRVWLRAAIKGAACIDFTAAIGGGGMGAMKAEESNIACRLLLEELRT